MSTEVASLLNTAMILLIGAGLAIFLAVAGAGVGVAADAMLQMWRRRGE